MVKKMGFMFFWIYIIAFLWGCGAHKITSSPGGARVYLVKNTTVKFPSESELSPIYLGTTPYTRRGGPFLSFYQIRKDGYDNSEVFKMPTSLFMPENKHIKLNYEESSKEKTIGLSNNHHKDINGNSSEMATPKRFVYKKADSFNKDAIAVIVGNRNYRSSDIPEVKFAHNDAESIYQYLVDSLGFLDDNIHYLKDATQADLMRMFGTANKQGILYNWVRSGKSDVFVYYSGHGVPSLESGKGYLMPVDAAPDAIDLSGYSLELLYRNLGSIPAQSMKVVIDACFSGGSAGGSIIKNASPAMLQLTEVRAPLPDAVVLTASNASEVASWNQEAKLGLFTSCFLEGVSGAADQKGYGNQDHHITLSELKKFLEVEVAYRARRQYNRNQSPQVIGNGDVVF